MLAQVHDAGPPTRQSACRTHGGIGRNAPDLMRAQRRVGKRAEPRRMAGLTHGKAVVETTQKREEPSDQRVVVTKTRRQLNQQDAAFRTQCRRGIDDPKGAPREWIRRSARRNPH